MARALLIANPNAARTERETVQMIETAMRGAGWSFEVLATGGTGDAERLARYGVESGADIVAVLGGDGTTMQAASALVGTGVTLALLPGGTGNLLAGNLRIPSNPRRAVEILLAGRPRLIDLGRLERPGGAQYFAVACGAGVDARVMTETPSALKHRWGMMAYVATTLRLAPEIRPTLYHVEIDGVAYDIEAAMIMVANCGEVIPPVVSLGAGIVPDDGWLDVVVFRAEGYTGSLRAIWHLLRDARGTYGHDAFVGRARGREISVRPAPGQPDQPVQLDGDGGGLTPFTVRVVHRSLRVMCPAG